MHSTNFFETRLKAVSGLLLYHLYLICHNMTTIEYYEGVPSRVSRGDTQNETHSKINQHIYDVGIKENIRQVLQ